MGLSLGSIPRKEADKCRVWRDGERKTEEGRSVRGENEKQSRLKNSNPGWVSEGKWLLIQTGMQRRAHLWDPLAVPTYGHNRGANGIKSRFYKKWERLQLSIQQYLSCWGKYSSSPMRVSSPLHAFSDQVLNVISKLQGKAVITKYSATYALHLCCSKIQYSRKVTLEWPHFQHRWGQLAHRCYREPGRLCVTVFSILLLWTGR